MICRSCRSPSWSGCCRRRRGTSATGKVSEGPERPAGSGPGTLLLSALHTSPGPLRLHLPPWDAAPPGLASLPSPRGSRAVRRRGGGPPEPLGRAPSWRWGSRGLGVGWRRGGVIVRSGHPGTAAPRQRPVPRPVRLPLGGGGRGARVPASFALFSSSSSPLLCVPSSHHPLDHLGRGWARLGAPPFFPSTWVGGGQRTLQLSLWWELPGESRLSSLSPSPRGPI